MATEGLATPHRLSPALFTGLRSPQRDRPSPCSPRPAGWSVAVVTSTEEGYANIVELLLAAGANVNAQDTIGKTPLQIATQKRHAEVTDVLRRFMKIASHSLKLLIRRQSGIDVQMFTVAR